MCLVLAYKTFTSRNNSYLVIDDQKTLDHYTNTLDKHCVSYIIIPFINEDDRDHFMKNQFKLMIED